MWQKKERTHLEKPSSPNVKYILAMSFGWLCILGAFSYYWNSSLRMEQANPSSSYSIVSPSLLAAGNETAKPAASMIFIRPIDAQLRALRDQRIQEAYDQTSQEFKAATSFKDFQDFISRNPILLNHSAITVNSQSADGQRILVDISLNPKEENAIIHYILQQERGEWKIWSMSLSSNYSAVVTELLLNPQSLQKPIEGQLQALREGDVIRAYNEFTMRQFRESTSLETFRTFLDTYPIIYRHEAAEFKRPIIEKETGKIEVDLHNKGQVLPIGYILGIEDNQWKIWNLQVIKPLKSKVEGISEKEATNTQGASSSEATSLLGKMTFVKLVVGTRINGQGAILDPGDPVSITEGDLYFNLYITAGKPGEKIEVVLEHLDSAATLPSLSTTLQQEGNSVISFSFSPPTQGWPKGTYKVHITSTDGARKLFSFQIV